MLPNSVLHPDRLVRPILSALAMAVIATLPCTPALAAGPTVQIEDFFFPDGSQVLSDGGMPFAHAALLRFPDRPKAGIIWQIMTQQVRPRTQYDIWIVGSNDDTDAGDFRWWVGSVMSTPRGDINAIGNVDVGVPLDPADGLFANADAPLYLVIADHDGTPVQSAFFPSP